MATKKSNLLVATHKDAPGYKVIIKVTPKSAKVVKVIAPKKDN